MSDKEKIKKEIERQIEEGKVKCQQSQESNDYESLVAWSEHVATCGKLLIFINSLLEESAVKGITWKDVNTLDTLINQVRHEFPNGISEKSFGLAVLEKFQDFHNDIEEPASEDLKEAMELSITYEPMLEFFCTGQPTIGAYNKDSLRNQFEAGAEWQKQQMKETLQTEYEKGRFDMREEMMKDAISCNVDWYDGFRLDYTQEQQDDILLKLGAGVGDKVKIIIVKED